MAATKPDPRCWDDRGSWRFESLSDVLDRVPAFGRRFLASAFGEFPTLAAVTQFVRRSEQPDDVYGVIGLPPGRYFQIDPDLEYLILWDSDGQAEYGNWGADQVHLALAHLGRLIREGDPPAPVRDEPGQPDLSRTTSTNRPRRRLTVRKFLGMAEDGVDRMLLDGEVWEVGLMIKNPLHGWTAATLVACLSNWLRKQPAPHGSLCVGNVGFQLDEGSVIGVDIAYASPELVARTPPDVEIFEGPPALAVEILAPGDRHGPLVARIRKYLQVGAVVWEVDSDWQHIRVHRPGLPVESFNVTQELVGDPYLPGYRVAVAEFFAENFPLTSSGGTS